MRDGRDGYNMQGQDDLDFEIDFYKSLLEKDPCHIDALQLLGEAYTRKGLVTEGLKIEQFIATLRPRDPIAHYNLACGYSLLRKKREAIQSLRKSIALGYRNIGHLVNDNDLSNLHEDTAFHRLLRSLCRKICARFSENNRG